MKYTVYRHFVPAALALSLLLRAAPALADENTAQKLDLAIALCDRTIQDAMTAAHSNYSTQTVREVASEIELLANDAEHTSRSPMISDLVGLAEQRISDEVADSYRWRNYSRLTLMTLMREVKSLLSTAKKYDFISNGG